MVQNYSLDRMVAALEKETSCIPEEGSSSGGGSSTGIVVVMVLLDDVARWDTAASFADEVASA